MKISLEKLKKIISEELQKEVSIASGERTVPVQGPESHFDQIKTIGGGVEGSPAELATQLDDAIIYLRSREKEDPSAAPIADQLIKMQQELNYQAENAAELAGEA